MKFVCSIYNCYDEASRFFSLSDGKSKTYGRWCETHFKDWVDASTKQQVDTTIDVLSVTYGWRAPYQPEVPFKMELLSFDEWADLRLVDKTLRE